MAYDRKDGWYRKAKREGYRSRAAYKLMEIDRRVRLFKPGMQVVDLGCAPGGWLQVVAKAVGRKGRVVGVDKLEMEPLDFAQVVMMRGDVTVPQVIDAVKQALRGPADIVLSDMAPNTSGVGFADHIRSIQLAELARDVARTLLKPRGTLVVKVFDGEDLGELISKFKKEYSQVKRIRPDSTRKNSKELYLVVR